MDHNKVIGFLDSCTYLSCVGTFIGWILGLLGTYAGGIMVIIAFASLLISWYYKAKNNEREEMVFIERRKYHTEQLEFEERRRSYSNPIRDDEEF